MIIYDLFFLLILMQIIESSTHKRALKNEPQAELLVYKKQCLESSNKIINLECIIAESNNEKQRMTDEYYKVEIVCFGCVRCMNRCF